MASPKSVITAAELIEKVGAGPGAAKLEAALAKAGLSKNVPSVLKTGAKVGAVGAVGAAAVGAANMLGNAAQAASNKQASGSSSPGGNTLASNAARSNRSSGSGAGSSGSGSLPPIRRASTPSVSPSMTTNKLIVTAINYLSSIDASLKNQVDMQRFSYSQNQTINRENAFETKGGDSGGGMLGLSKGTSDSLGKGMGLFLLMAMGPLLKSLGDIFKPGADGKSPLDKMKKAGGDILDTVTKASTLLLPAGLGVAAYKGYKASRTPLDMNRSMYSLTEAEKANLARQKITGGGIHYTKEGSKTPLNKSEVFKAASKGSVVTHTKDVLKSSMMKGLKTTAGISLAVESLGYIFGDKKVNASNLAESAGGLIGSVLGGALGSLLSPIIGPLGTIGGAIGGDMIGRKLGSSLASLFGVKKEADLGGAAASPQSNAGGIKFVPSKKTIKDPRSMSEDVRMDIRKAEGTAGENGYDVSLGGKMDPRTYPGWKGRKVALSELTLDESLQWGEIIKQTAGAPKKRGDLPSSAKGAYQIVNQTQRGAMASMGMKGDELFDVKNQNRIADWIAANQGIRPEIWAGFANHPEELKHAQSVYYAKKETDKKPKVNAKPLPKEAPKVEPPNLEPRQRPLPKSAQPSVKVVVPPNPNAISPNGRSAQKVPIAYNVDPVPWVDFLSSNGRSSYA
jgi:hypothetical protein